MPQALLIVFEYRTNSLRGARCDLDNARNWCLSWGCQVKVITDIDREEFLDLDEIKRQIVEALAEADDSKLIVYYSGHGDNGAMLLPSNQNYNFSQFWIDLCRLLSPTSEIFAIVDCCNPSGFDLPWKLDRLGWKLESNFRCITQPTILITSADNQEKSLSSNYGSLFSGLLFTALTNLDYQLLDLRAPIPLEKNRHLRRLMGGISSSMRKTQATLKRYRNYSQTVSIYSSYDIDPLLWMWIGSPTNGDLVSNPSQTALIFRFLANNQEQEQS